MGINDSNKTDQFDNEQTQLVHNDVAYQGATETTAATINGKINTTTTTPQISNSGIIVRTIPYRPPTFTVTATNVTLANLKSLIAIQNTGTSIVKISKIYLVNTRTTNVTGVATNLQLKRIVSFAGGTNIDSHPHNTLNTLPAGISIATGSTIASESALFRDSFWSSDEWSPGTLDVEALDHSNQELTPWYNAKDNEEPITLVENQGLHVKCNTNTTAGTFTITIVFTAETA